MAGNYTVNLYELARQAFGMSGLKQYVPSSLKNDGRINYGRIQTVDISPATATSMLGTPIIMPVAFDKVRWQILDDNGNKKWLNVPAFTFPAATLIDFQQAKKIVKTEIAGRDGTVKEYIGMDDWQLRIRSIIVNESNPDDPPEQIIRQINELKNVPVSIPIVNDMCAWLGIYDVVIESIEFPALEGFPGVQPVVLECSSDVAFEVKYKNGL